MTAQVQKSKRAFRLKEFMTLADTAKALETLTKVPSYFLVGSTRDRVVYISNEDGAYCLWSFDGKSGSKVRMTSEPVEQTATPRHVSNEVFYTIDTAKGAELHKIYQADATEGGEALAVDVQSMRIEGLATAGAMVAFTGATKEEIAIFTSESGSMEKRTKLGALAIVTDASRKYLVGYGWLEGNPRSYELFIFNLSTGQLQTYTPKPGSLNKIPVLNGSRMLFESNFTGKNRLHVYDIETRELVNAPFTFPDYVAYDATEHPYFDWTDDGRIWLVGKKEGEAKAFIDGRQVPTPPGYLWGLALQNEKAYVSHSTVVQPPRVLEIEPDTGQTKVIIDNQLPPSIREKFSQSRSRFIHYKSFDGRNVPALVVDDGTDNPRPTITYVHGGPWADVLNTWRELLASFLLMGYNIIAPNYRGSTGYGEDYKNLDIGDPGGDDLKDIVFAARWAKENRLASDNAIAGYSYGGYTTLLALGREPEVWSCGVAGAPIADWKEAYELCDAEYRNFIDMLFDHKMELLEDRSPVTHVKNVKKPVCIISSQNDSRTPMKPVLKYAMNLLDRGVKFELHSVPDMGHMVRSTQDVMDIVYPTIAFLQRQFPAQVDARN